MDTIRDRFAANLRRLREEAGVSQEELAARSELHRTAISLLERGECSPRLETVVALSRGLGGTVPGRLLDGIH